MGFAKRWFSDSLVTFEKQLGFQNKIRWKFVFLLGFVHCFTFYWGYLYAFSAKWQSAALALLLGYVGGLGITCGAHRYWTHKSYKAKLPLRIILMLFFSSAGQNSIYAWVRDHRSHHKCSDTEADPHNSNRGFFFCHIGWLMSKKNDLVLEKGQQIDMSDMEADPVVMFERKYSSLLSLVTCFILPVITIMTVCDEVWRCALAWTLLKWLFALHNELTVNSLAHMFGNKPYDINIKPSENVFVSTITFGEGYHNYHHAFPNDYKAAETTWNILNSSTIFIRLCEKIGLAYDLREPSPESIQAVIKRKSNLRKRRDQENKGIRTNGFQSLITQNEFN